MPTPAVIAWHGRCGRAGSCALASVVGGWDRAIIIWQTPPVVRHTAQYRMTLDIALSITSSVVMAVMSSPGLRPELLRPSGCYRPRYLNTQRLNCLWTVRHSSARIAGNLITWCDCRRLRVRAYPPFGAASSVLLRHWPPRPNGACWCQAGSHDRRRQM